MNKFQTSDIVLAATLKYHGYKLSNMTVEGSRGTFHFESVDDAFISKFDALQITIEPVGFYDIIRQLSTSVKRLTK